MQCFGILVALSLMCMVSARPQNGMFFYQQQSAPTGFYQRQPVAQRMYVQYQPYRANRRSANVGAGGLSAYAAGNSVATGTYLRQTEINDDYADVQQTQQDGTISVAEAYPEETGFVQNDQADEIVPLNDEAPIDDAPLADPIVPEVAVTVNKKKSPKEFVPAAEAPAAPEEDVPSADEVEQDAAVAPAKSPAKKKKVRVELENDEEDEDADVVPFYTKTNRNGGNPINTFFPVSFGRTSGGAIAVANSFSTGKGGTATSHATAYGSPASKKSKLKNRTAEA